VFCAVVVPELRIDDGKLETMNALSLEGKRKRDVKGRRD